MDVLSVLTMIIGFSMLAIGLAIWIGKNPDIIAGYDAETCPDPERLSMIVGQGLTLMGLGSMALGLAGELFGLANAALIGLIGVPVVGAMALVLLTRDL